MQRPLPQQPNKISNSLHTLLIAPSPCTCSSSDLHFRVQEKQENSTLCQRQDHKYFDGSVGSLNNTVLLNHSIIMVASQVIIICSQNAGPGLGRSLEAVVDCL